MMDPLAQFPLAPRIRAFYNAFQGLLASAADGVRKRQTHNQTEADVHKSIIYILVSDRTTSGPRMLIKMLISKLKDISTAN